MESNIEDCYMEDNMVYRNKLIALTKIQHPDNLAAIKNPDIVRLHHTHGRNTLRRYAPHILNPQFQEADSNSA